MSRAPRLGVYSRRLSAFSTGLPRIRSTTRRAFCAVIRMNRLCARVSITLPGPCAARQEPRRHLARAAPRGRHLRPCPCDRPSGRGTCAWVQTHRAYAPRRLRMFALRAALAATVRVIHGVHRDATDTRAPPEPADAPGLAVRDVLVFEVADLPDRRPAG